MTDVFTASNGLQINWCGSLCGQEPSLATGNDIHTARFEFYQQLRDTELERWRWPLYPEYVVYSGRRPILVLNELTGDTLRARRTDEFKEDRDGTIYAAAVAYFQAHPERKPWEDAKPGEAWEITYTGLASPQVTKVAIRTDRNTWKTDVLEMEFNHAITAARRIWPEDAS